MVKHKFETGGACCRKYQSQKVGILLSLSPQLSYLFWWHVYFVISSRIERRPRCMESGQPLINPECRLIQNSFILKRSSDVVFRVAFSWCNCSTSCLNSSNLHFSFAFMNKIWAITQTSCRTIDYQVWFWGQSPHC